MQIVPREVLQKLIQVENESESDDINLFSECIKLYNSFLKEADQNDIVLSKSQKDVPGDKFDYAYRKLLKTFLKPHKKAFKFVGRGSSREVFAMPGGKCLKIAHSRKGAMQNQQEAMNSQHTYECFPVIHGVDTEQHGVIMAECCSPICISSTLNDFSLAYGKGILLIHVIATLNDIVNVCHCDIKKAEKSLAWSVSNGQYFDGEENDEYDVSHEIRLKICRNIINDKSPSYGILRNIIKFYSDHGKNDNSMLLADLEFSKNWGLAIRRNKIVPVVIDSGFSETIRDLYY